MGDAEAEHITVEVTIPVRVWTGERMVMGFSIADTNMTVEDQDGEKVGDVRPRAASDGIDLTCGDTRGVAKKSDLWTAFRDALAEQGFEVPTHE